MSNLVANVHVAVALSGGIDSLYTLLALHEQGVSVVGLHGLFAQHKEFVRCGSKVEYAESRQEPDAVTAALAACCHKLGIAFHTLDCGEPFCSQVITPFVESYAAGHTPNPCALCNARIKFGLLQEHAVRLGATHLATGHYARLLYAAGHPLPAGTGQVDPVLATLQQRETLQFIDGAGSTPAFSRTSLGEVLLLQGADLLKDQSYFLSLVPGFALAHALFPLGILHKTDVSQRLQQLAVVPPQSVESQEVCFIPGDAYREFVPLAAEYMQLPLGGPGPIKVVNEEKVVGQHKGLWQYTEGQRKGLGIAWKEPLYVLQKDKKNNTLVLGAKRELLGSRCVCTQVNCAVPAQFWPQQVFIRIRYREKPKQGTARLVDGPHGTLLVLEFAETAQSIALGQVGAVYAPIAGVTESDGRPVFCFLAGGLITSL